MAVAVGIDLGTTNSVIAVTEVVAAQVRGQGPEPVERRIDANGILNVSARDLNG